MVKWSLVMLDDALLYSAPRNSYFLSFRSEERYKKTCVANWYSKPAHSYLLPEIRAFPLRVLMFQFHL